MTEGELVKRIRKRWATMNYFAGPDEEFLAIFDEAKKDIKIPYVISYPCEHQEARSVYERQIKEFREKWDKWFGSS